MLLDRERYDSDTNKPVKSHVGVLAMSKPVVSGPRLGHGATVSLVALAACALAGDALASRPRTDWVPETQEISNRVDAIAEQLRLGDPLLQREVPPPDVLAQWRNFR